MLKNCLLPVAFCCFATHAGAPVYHLDLLTETISGDAAIVLAQANYHVKTEIRVSCGGKSIPVTTEVWQGRRGFQYSMDYHLIRPAAGRWPLDKPITVSTGEQTFTARAKADVPETPAAPEIQGFFKQPIEEGFPGRNGPVRLVHYLSFKPVADAAGILLLVVEFKGGETIRYAVTTRGHLETKLEIRDDLPRCIEKAFFLNTANRQSPSVKYCK